MAIQKQKDLPSGISGNYWKISKVNLDTVNSRCGYSISLFKDKATSDAGASSLGFSKSFQFPLSDEELVGDLRAVGYAKIKEKAAMLVMNLQGEQTNIAFDPDLANGIDV